MKKFNLSKAAMALTLAIATGNAQAVLTSFNTLSIENDAVTAQNTSGTDYVVSNGPLLDSFFTLNGSKEKQFVGTQYAYLYNGASLTLTGATQSNIAAFTVYSGLGNHKTTGTGISVLSASGDTATVNMTGWKVDWWGVNDIPFGTGAWSAGYTSGVGNIACTVGSGCAVGSAYTLTYTATVPLGDPSGFGGVKYYLELHGTVSGVPEASTYGMMLAGLGLIGVVARRRRT